MQQRRSRRTQTASAEELFGQTLRELRRDKGMSQEDLAFKSGYHPTYISQLERGKKSPSLRAIISLAGTLNTPGSEILRHIEAVLAKAKPGNLDRQAGATVRFR